MVEKKSISLIFIIFMISSFVTFFLLNSCEKSALEKRTIKNEIFNSHKNVDFPVYYKSLIKQNALPLDDLYKGDFHIVSAGPQGEFHQFLQREYLYVIFSSPVVNLAKIGKKCRKGSCFSIIPPISGEERWIGQNALIFEPSGGYFKDGAYQVIVNKRIKSLAGKELKESYCFNFTPQLFEIKDFWSGVSESILNQTLRKRKQLSLKNLKRLYFETSYPVHPKQLIKQLEIRSGLDTIDYKIKKKIEIREENDHYIYQIKLKDKVNEGALLKLVYKGIPIDGRTLKIRGEFRLTSVYQDFDSQQLYYFPQKADIYYLTLEFSSMPNFESLRDRVFINNQIVDLSDFKIRGNQVLYIGPLLNQTEMSRLRLLSGICDIDGRLLSNAIESDIPKRQNGNRQYLNSPYHKQNFISTASPPVLEVEVSHVTQGGWRIYSDEQELDSWATYPFSINSDYYPQRGTLPISDFFPNYQLGDTFSASLDINSDEEASLFSFSDVKEPLHFQITNLSITAMSQKDHLILFLTDRGNGELLRGASFSLYYRGKKIAQATSDEYGSSIFYEADFDQKYSFNQMEVHASYKGDFIAYKMESSDFIDDGERGVIKRRAFLTAQKAVYNPGEKVSLSILDIIADKKGVKAATGGYHINLKRIGPKPRQFYSVKGNLHPSGVVKVLYQLPELLLTGQYLLTYEGPGSIGEVRIDIQGDGAGSFLSLDQENFVAGDKIHVELKNLREDNQPAASCESILSMKVASQAISSHSLPWDDAYVGPYRRSEKQATLRRTVYADINGNSFIKFDSRNLLVDSYQEPLKVELSPSVIINGHLYGGTDKVITVNPSEFYIAARKRGKNRELKAGKKITIDFTLVDTIHFTRLSQPFSARVTAEVVPLDAQGNKEKVLQRKFELTKSKSGKFSFRLKKGGAYRLSLKTKDSRGNLVITELPLWVTGKESYSDYVKMVADSKKIEQIKVKKKEGNGSLYQIPVWINLPAEKNFLRGKSLVLIKECLGEPIIIPIPSFKASNQVMIPVDTKDFPGFYLHLVSWDIIKQSSKAKPSLFSAITHKASCWVNVPERVLNCPSIKIDFDKELLASEVVSVHLQSDLEDESGSLFATFVHQDEQGVSTDMNPVDFYEHNWIKNSKYFIQDVIERTPGGLLDKSGDQMRPFDHPFLLLPHKNIKTTVPIYLESGSSSSFNMKLPDQSGSYLLILKGLWQGKPFYQTKALEVMGKPSLQIHVASQLQQRDTTVGFVLLSDTQLKVDKKKVVVRFELPKDSGIEIYPPRIILAAESNWRAPFTLVAHAVGKYPFVIKIEEQQSLLELKQSVEVLPSASLVHYPIALAVDGNKKNKEVSDFSNTKQRNLESNVTKILQNVDHIDSTLNCVMALRKQKAYHDLAKIFSKGRNLGTVDGRISSLLPWIMRGDQSLTDYKGYHCDQALMFKILMETDSYQHQAGGLPLLTDRNIAMDYYSTVRTADILQMSGVSYYRPEFPSIGAMRTYLKLAFKGENSANYSHYIKCYSAWVLARYKENVIPIAKKLIDTDQCSLAEQVLASLALIYAGEEYGVDLSQYLKETLLRAALRFDPSLKVDQKPMVNSTLHENLYGLDRPGSKAVECALSYLLFNRVKGYKREAQNALDQLLDQNFSDLNFLDASFVYRALDEADKALDLDLFNLNADQLLGSVELNYDSQRVCNFNLASSQNILPYFFSKFSFNSQASFKKSKKWELISKMGDEMDAELFFDFKIPPESLQMFSSGYSLFTQWLDADGVNIDSKLLKVGKKYDFRILLASNSGTGAIRLEVPFPPAINVSLDSIFIFSSNFLNQFGIEGKSSAYIKKEIVGNQVILTWQQLEHYFDEIIINVSSDFPGIFPFGAVTLKNLYQEDRYANSDGDVLLFSSE